jgi:integrase
MGRKRVGGVRVLPSGSKQGYFRHQGEFFQKVWSKETDDDVIYDWNAKELARLQTSMPATAKRGSFQAEVDKFVAREKPVQPRDPRDPDSRKRWRRHADFTMYLGFWTRAIGADKNPLEVGVRAFQDVLDRWQADGHSASNLNKRRTALLSFFNWLLIGTEDVVNPATKLKHYQEPTKDKPDTIDPDLVVKILDEMENTPTKARLGLMFTTGARQSEIQRLRPENFDLAGTGSNGSHYPKRTPSVHYKKAGKGGRARHVPLPVDSLGYEFARMFLQMDAFGMFSNSSLRKSFIAAARRAGVREDQLVVGKWESGRVRWAIKPYALRHTFATYRRKQGDIADVGYLLGHTPGSRQTHRYADVDQGKVLAMFKQEPDGTFTPPTNVADLLANISPEQAKELLIGLLQKAPTV